jgi:hypothetical protein
LRFAVKQLLIALAAVVAADAHADPARFDLICEGQAGHFSGPGDAFVPSEPWSRRYAVDLSAGAFCVSGCGMIVALSAVDAGRIAFFSHGRESEEVNRIDGSMEFVNDEGMVIKATCKVAPFTPFPKTMF